MGPTAPLSEQKIVILGSGGVGKSALTVQFVHSIFVEKYDPTIEDSYRKIVTVDDARFDCEILDTAGTEQFMALHSLYIKTGDAFVLVFSLATLDSVNELTTIRQQILRIKEADGIPEKDIPIVLVGNKCDLIQERQVPRDVGVALSGLWGGVPYYETSARKRVNVEEVFEDVLRQIIRRDQSRRGANGVINPVGNHRRRSRKRTSRCVIL